MTTIVYHSIGQGAPADALTILDAERRTYAGLSHDGTYWHLIAPFAGEGNLVCTCVGGRTHGRCWRMSQAIAFEAGDARQATHLLAPPAWQGPDPRAELLAGVASFDAPVGAGGAGIQVERG